MVTRLTATQGARIRKRDPLELLLEPTGKLGARFARARHDCLYDLMICDAADLEGGAVYYVRDALDHDAIRDLVEELTASYEAHRVVAPAVHPIADATNTIAAAGGDAAWTAAAGTLSVFVQLNAIRTAVIAHQADVASHNAADVQRMDAACVEGDILSAIELANALLALLGFHMADATIHDAADAVNAPNQALRLTSTTLNAGAAWGALLEWVAGSDTDGYTTLNEYSSTFRHQAVARQGLGRFLVRGVVPSQVIAGALGGDVVRRLQTTAEWDGTSNMATTLPNVTFPAAIDPADCAILVSVRATAGGNEERYIATSYIDTGEIVTRCRSVVGSPVGGTAADIDILVVGAPA